MTDFEVSDALEEVKDFIDEYDEEGAFWSDDEVREAFVSALPALRVIVDRLVQLYA